MLYERMGSHEWHKLVTQHIPFKRMKEPWHDHSNSMIKRIMFLSTYILFSYIIFLMSSFNCFCFFRPFFFSQSAHEYACALGLHSGLSLKFLLTSPRIPPELLFHSFLKHLPAQAPSKSVITKHSPTHLSPHGACLKFISLLLTHSFLPQAVWDYQR